MRYAGILAVIGPLLAVGSFGQKQAAMGDSKQQETVPAVDAVAETAKAPEPAPALRVPAGFKAKDGTTPEPYSKTGWAKEIVHEAAGIEMTFIPAGEFMMGCRSTGEATDYRRMESPGTIARSS